MKIFSMWLMSGPEPEESPEDQRARWRRDPLSHPEIAAMSLRERADLPLCPTRLSRIEEDCSA